MISTIAVCFEVFLGFLMLLFTISILNDIVGLVTGLTIFQSFIMRWIFKGIKFRKANINIYLNSLELDINSENNVNILNKYPSISRCMSSIKDTCTYRIELTISSEYFNETKQVLRIKGTSVSKLLKEFSESSNYYIYRKCDFGVLSNQDINCSLYIVRNILYKDKLSANLSLLILNFWLNCFTEEDFDVQYEVNNLAFLSTNMYAVSSQ